MSALSGFRRTQRQTRRYRGKKIARPWQTLLCLYPLAGLQHHLEQKTGKPRRIDGAVSAMVRKPVETQRGKALRQKESRRGQIARRFFAWTKTGFGVYDRGNSPARGAITVCHHPLVGQP